jgi:hypothetical protein
MLKARPLEALVGSKTHATTILNLLDCYMKCSVMVQQLGTGKVTKSNDSCGVNSDQALAALRFLNENVLKEQSDAHLPILPVNAAASTPA